MSSQLIPIVQINALPVLTISGAIQGTLYNVGGRISRYFSPTDLSINANALSSFAAPGGDFYWYLATPFLNLTGCSLFSMLLVRNINTNAAQISPGATLWMQRRIDPLDVPPVTYFETTTNNQAQEMAGMVKCATTFGVAGNANSRQRMLLNWGGVNFLSVGAAAALGGDQRFIMDMGGIAAARPGGDSTWTASLWAS